MDEEVTSVRIDSVFLSGEPITWATGASYKTLRIIPPQTYPPDTYNMEVNFIDVHLDIGTCNF